MQQQGRGKRGCCVRKPAMAAQRAFSGTQRLLVFYSRALCQEEPAMACKREFLGTERLLFYLRALCQGESSASAEPSEGCQACSAAASLKRTPG